MVPQELGLTSLTHGYFSREADYHMAGILGSDVQHQGQNMPTRRSAIQPAGDLGISESNCLQPQIASCESRPRCYLRESKLSDTCTGIVTIDEHREDQRTEG